MNSKKFYVSEDQAKRVGLTNKLLEREIRSQSLPEIHIDLASGPDQTVIHDRERNIIYISPTELCHKFQVQNCHFCDNIDCGDNTNPIVEKLRNATQSAAYWQKQFKKVYDIVLEISKESANEG